MVKRIKKVKRGPKRRSGSKMPAWYVPFNAEGRAGVYIHRHGDGDDHSSCGPVVMCCERAKAPYEALAPDIVTRVTDYKAQWADHLCSWLDDGVQAMYFVLCDPDDEDAVYQFGLPGEQARAFLLGRRSHDHDRRPEYHVAPES